MLAYAACLQEGFPATADRGAVGVSAEGLESLAAPAAPMLSVSLSHASSES